MTEQDPRIDFDKIEKAMQTAYHFEWVRTEGVVTGEFIKDIRLKLNFTQTVFAAILNVSCKKLARWEKSKRARKGAVSILFYLIYLNPNIVGSLYYYGKNSDKAKSFVGEKAR